MSEPMDARYEITVSGTDQSIAWVLATFDLEKEGGGLILSKPPIEQRGVDPVTATLVILVYFSAKAFGAAAEEFGKEVGGALGREAVDRYVSKLRENGAEVEVTVEDVEPSADVPELDPALQAIAQQLKKQQDDEAAMNMLVRFMDGRSPEEIHDIGMRAVGRLRATEDRENWTFQAYVQNVGLIVADEE